MGALLLTAGAKGKRFALPHAGILIHQPLGGFQGQATDVEIQAREILRLREELNEIMARDSGQPIDRINLDTERDFYMSGLQAKEYGLVDEVISTPIVRAEGRSFKPCRTSLSGILSHPHWLRQFYRPNTSVDFSYHIVQQEN